MRAAVALAVAAVATSCGGGEAVERTVSVTTVETVAPTTAPDEDRAYLLALDFCANAPLETISLLRGDSPEELARDFADEIRPELREAALSGCLAGLERRG